MPADPARAQEVFLAATERADPADRSAYLDQACAGDAALRARVEALLRALDQPDSFLDAPLAASADPAATQAFPSTGTGYGDGPRGPHGGDVDNDLADVLTLLVPPRRPDSLGRIGHYEVLEILGRGGFGVVFRAFDEVLQRVVAVKVLAPSLAVTSPARKRFLREARASAPIQHENVVRVYEVGEQPLPYLVMELIRGETLQQALDRTGPLEVADVVRIGRQIALGLAAAHEQGLIHRDIKPSNILIDNSPRRHVKITDFGLARAADDASLTRSGVVAGTPMYMAPEQARGEALDHRADLFSLGSVLYTMLTGHPPFRAETTLAVLRRVVEDTPRPIREVIPEVPAWLCRIVEKLQAKDPAARYQSAAEVADVLADCEQQLKASDRLKEPAPAAPRRRRLAVVALTLMALLAGGLGLTEATGVTDLKGTVVRLFTPSGTLVVEVDDPQVKVTIDGEDLVIHGAGLQEVRLKTGTYKLRAIKDGQAVREELVTITRGGKQVVRVSREPSGVTGSGHSDPQEKSSRLVPFANLDSQKVITCVALSPDEKTLAVGSADGDVLLYDVAGRWKRGVLKGHTLEVSSVAFSPDGNKLVTGAGDWRKPGTPGEVKVWDVAASKEDRPLPWETGPVLAVAWAADQKIAAAGQSGVVKLWSAKDATELPFQAGHPGPVHDLTFSPDGRLLASASADRTVRLWNVAAGKLAGTLKGHEDECDRVRFSPDGKLVASGSRDRTIKLWDPQTFKEQATLQGHGSWVHSLAFSAGGDVLFAGDNAHQTKAWDVAVGKPLADLSVPAGQTGGMIALARQSRVLVTAHPFGAIHFWDVGPLLGGNTTQVGSIRRFKGHTGWVISLAFSPDGRFALSGSHDQTLRLWDVGTGEERKVFQSPGGWVEAVAFAPDGRRALSGHQDGVMRLWDLETGKVLVQFRGHKAGVRSVAFSPDGRRALSGSKDGTLRLWAADSGEEVRVFEGHTDLVESVAFALDGRHVLSGSWDRTLRLWDVETGQEVRRFEGNLSGVESVAFSPDGAWALSGGGDASVRLWEVATGKEARRFEGHTEAVNAVAFSPDGRHALSGSRDRTVRLWDVKSGRALHTFEGHQEWVYAVAFSPDGRFALSGGGGGIADGRPVQGSDFALRLWALPDTGGEAVPGDSWIPLFNGKDLTGWTRRYGALDAWTVKNGVLVGRDEHYSELVTERGTFQDYELRLEARINAGGDSGVFNRIGLEKGGFCYEVQIGCHDAPGPHTGAVLVYGQGEERKNQHDARARLTRPGEWFTLEITLRDNRIVTRVNGATTVDYVGPEQRCRQGHIILQLIKGTVVEFRKIEVRELPKVGAREQPFVLLTGGAEKRAYATLSEAVAAAADGATIEIRGNGPFVTAPIVITGKGLTIRSGAGWRSVIRLSPEGVAAQERLIRTDAALTLEGLELQWLGPKGRKVGLHAILVYAHQGPLAITSCRFVVENGNNAVTTDSGTVICRNSEFICPAHGGLDWHTPPEGRLVMDNCINVTQGGSAFHYGLRDFKNVSAQLTHNTVIGHWTWVLFLDRPEVDSAVRPLQVRAEGNVFSATGAVWSVNDPRNRPGVAPTADGPPALRRLFAWQGGHNLFPDAPVLVDLPGPDQPRKGVRALSDWERFWGIHELGSLQGKPRYKNGDVVARAYADPRQVHPEDFRLHRDSPGKGAGEGGRDLGADVDLVGPGAAYERWKKTAAYQQWLKETGQVQARDPAAGPFVLLARNGNGERKFATLAEAVHAADDGDTIEVHGNGPFLTNPVKIEDRALVIRAAAGCRPIVAMSREGLEGKEPLLTTNAPLTLEGLELQRLGGQPAVQGSSILSVLVTSGPELRLAHCRLLINRREGPQYGIHCINVEGAADCQLQNCEVLATGGAAVATAGGHVKLQSCIIAGYIGLLLYRAPNQDQPIPVSLRGNTVVAQHALQWNLRLSKEEAADPSKVWFCAAKENILTGDVCFNQEGTTLGEKRYLPADAAAVLLPRVVEWREERNVYGESDAVLELAGDLKTLPGGRRLRTLADWQRLWSLKTTSSLLGRARFRGGDVAHKAYHTPREVTPQDFALAARSPGKGAGEGGRDLGADVDLVGPGAAYERWKKTAAYQQWLKETGQVQARDPAAGPFVLLARNGNDERKLATLAEAARAADDGDTIEVRGNGPFVTGPIRVGKDLTVHAAAGFRPVIRLSQEAVDAGEKLLEVSAPLTLEGLELQRLGQRPQREGDPPAILLVSHKAPVYAANCRFLVRHGIAVSSHQGPALELRNCELLCPEHTAVGWGQGAEGRLVLESCVQLGHSGNALHYDHFAFRDVRVRLTRNTFVATTGWYFYLFKAEAGPDVRPTRLEATENVFDTSGQVLAAIPWYRAKVNKPPRLEELLPRLLRWQGQCNLYPSKAAMLAFGEPDAPAKHLSTLAEWKQYWNSAESGSLLDSVRYQGGDLRARAAQAPEQLVPEDFRLHRDSPGKGAGEGGRDLGADVDLVGPGAAYELWRKSPEYRQWLKVIGK